MLPITQVNIWYNNYLMSKWRFKFPSSSFIFNALLDVPLIFLFSVVLLSVSPGRQKQSIIHLWNIRYNVKLLNTFPFLLRTCRVHGLINGIYLREEICSCVYLGNSCRDSKRCALWTAVEMRFWILWCHCSVETFISLGAAYIEQFFAVFGKWFKHCLKYL